MTQNTDCTNKASPYFRSESPTPKRRQKLISIHFRKQFSRYSLHVHRTSIL